MIEKMIQNYVNKMTVDDIKHYAKINNISLTREEAEMVFEYVKKNWHEICYGKETTVLNDAYSLLPQDTYDKVAELFLAYRKKYKRYL